MRRQYAGGAKPTTLTGNLGGSTADLSISGADFANYPDGSIGPFYIVIDRGQVTEEKILCSSRTGNTITVYNTGLTNGRGNDGTSVVAHSVGATVEHIFTATDADEANSHVNNILLHIQTTQRVVSVVTSTTRPVSPAIGQIIYETDTTKYFGWNGSIWVAISLAVLG